MDRGAWQAIVRRVTKESDTTEQLNNNTWPGQTSVRLKTKEKAKVGSANLGFLLTLTKQTSRPWWANMCQPDVPNALLLKVKSGELLTQGWLWWRRFPLLFLSFTFSQIHAASCGVNWHVTKLAPVEIHTFLSYSARKQERLLRSRGCAGQGAHVISSEGAEGQIPGTSFPFLGMWQSWKRGKTFGFPWGLKSWRILNLFAFRNP